MANSDASKCNIDIMTGLSLDFQSTRSLPKRQGSRPTTALMKPQIVNRSHRTAQLRALSSSSKSLHRSIVASPVCVKKKMQQHTKLLSSPAFISIPPLIEKNGSKIFNISASAEQACRTLALLKTLPCDEKDSSHEPGSSCIKNTKTMELEIDIYTDEDSGAEDSLSNTESSITEEISSVRVSETTETEDFNSIRILEAADDLWKDLMTIDPDNVIMNVCDIDELEPISLSALTCGSSVDADNDETLAGLPVERVLMSPVPFGMTEEEYLSAASPEQISADYSPIRRSRGKRISALKRMQQKCKKNGRFVSKRATRSSMPNLTFQRSPTSAKERRNTFSETSEKRKTTRKNQMSSNASKMVHVDAEAVGPQSWQMMAVYRMIIFMEEMPGCQHSKYSENFRAVVAKCKVLHESKSPKYVHLPGAIFEEMVDIMGGPAFLEVYLASKNFNHPRVTKACCDNQILVSDEKTILTINAATGCPNLLELSVAYGYHLAQSPKKQKNPLKYVIEQGAHDVLNLNEAERAEFWANIIEAAVFD